MSRSALATCFLLLLAPWARCEGPLDLDATTALVDAARARLTPSGSEPVRIEARLRFPFDEKAPEGRLLHARAGRGLSRSEWMLPGWRQLEIRNADGAWSWVGPDNAATMRVLSDQVIVLLHPVRLLGLSVEEAGRRVLVDGRPLVKVELGSRKGARRTAWLDETSAELVAVEDETTRHDFGGGSSAGGRYWPRIVRLRSGGRPLIAATFGKPVGGSDAVPAGLLVPPDGAQRRANETTEGLIQPRLLEAPDPVWPAGERRSNVNGTIVLRILIGTDGLVREAEVLEGDSRALERMALRAARGRVYTPALLDGEPIEIESTIRVEIKLGTGEVRRLGVRPRSEGAR